MTIYTVSLQTSPAIVAVPVPQKGSNAAAIGVYEFLSKSFAYCPIEILHWLSYFLEPHTRLEAQNDHRQYSESSLNTDIDGLIDAGFLVDVTGEHGKRCSDYREKWKWDLTTAAFHFTVLNNSFCTPDESVAQQIASLAIGKQPEYFWPPQPSNKIALANPFVERGHNTINLLAKRRTVRNGSGDAVSFEELSSCLFASFGIVGQVKSTTGFMPLTMTPSGGARNPYEAFVIIKRCQGLSAGVYRYCAIEHVLELVQPIDPSDSIAYLFAGQDWLDEMAATVVMVAVFERTMWKYQDPNAYRVILIEAGHKAQNFMIMATRLGLTSCPSAALMHDQLADFLMLYDKLMQVPVYAFSLDKAMHNKDEIIPNQTFEKLHSEYQTVFA
jgi:SagB-type dehydrogenase family enzyme